MKPHGLILAGGRSARFGRPKALALWQGRTLVEQAAAILKPHVDRLAVSVGPASRRLVLPGADVLAGVACLEDRRPDAGPLAALEAAAAWMPGNAICVLAVDLPAVTPADVARLLAVAGDAGADADVVCAQSTQDDRLQPLFGIWRPRALAHAVTCLDAGTGGVLRCLDGLTVVSVGMDAGVLKNVNRPEDMG